MKPTELEPNHVIYVGDTGNVFYNDEWKPVVKIKLTQNQSKNDYVELFEYLEDGTITRHSLLNISTNDIIELSPASYGFCFSRDNSTSFSYDGSFSIYYPSTEIDISDYDTSKITNFSGMFLKCDKIIGIENLDTSNGINFKMMFYESKVRTIPINLSSAQSANLYIPIYSINSPLDFTGSIISSNYQTILNKTSNFFEDVYKDNISNIQTKKIICDNENFANFVHLCAVNQGYAFEFVKPNGEAWSFE